MPRAIGTGGQHGSRPLGRRAAPFTETRWATVSRHVEGSTDHDHVACHRVQLLSWASPGGRRRRWPRRPAPTRPRRARRSSSLRDPITGASATAGRRHHACWAVKERGTRGAGAQLQATVPAPGAARHSGARIALGLGVQKPRYRLLPRPRLLPSGPATATAPPTANGPPRLTGAWHSGRIVGSAVQRPSRHAPRRAKPARPSPRRGSASRIGRTPPTNRPHEARRTGPR